MTADVWAFHCNRCHKNTNTLKLNDQCTVCVLQTVLKRKKTVLKRNDRCVSFIQVLYRSVLFTKVLVSPCHGLQMIDPLVSMAHARAETSIYFDRSRLLQEISGVTSLGWTQSCQDHRWRLHMCSSGYNDPREWQQLSIGRSWWSQPVMCRWHVFDSVITK